MQDDNIDLEEYLEVNDFGTFTKDPTFEQLQTYFKLSKTDFEFLSQNRSPHSKLGMALQLCTLRFLGTFLNNLESIPAIVVDFVQKQLEYPFVDLTPYWNTVRTRSHHQQLIISYLGYREFRGSPVLAIGRLLLERLSVAEEKEYVLLDLVTQTLIEQNIVLPGVSTLQRLIRRARKRVRQRLYHQICSRLSKSYQLKLESLLLVPKGDHRTLLDQLRSTPSHASSRTILSALTRVTRIREFIVSSLKLEDIAENRIDVLVRTGMTTKAATLGLQSHERCMATLAMTMRHLEFQAIDEVLIIFEMLMRELGLRAQKRIQRERLRSLKDLDAAALTLRDAVKLVLDPKVPSRNLRQLIIQEFSESTLQTAVLNVTELTTTVEDSQTEIWQKIHQGIAQFIDPMLETIEFDGTVTAKPLLEGVAFAKRLSKVSRAEWGLPPRGFIPKSWLPLIFSNGSKGIDGDFDRSKYLVCLTQQLEKALKRGDVFVERSIKYADPRAGLLVGDIWEEVKLEVHQALRLPLRAKDFLEKQSKTLDVRLKEFNEGMTENSNVKLKLEGDELKITLSPLEKLPDNEVLTELNKEVSTRLPEVALAELLLEINARTGFITAMLEPETVEVKDLQGKQISTSVPVARRYAKDLEVSMAAVLLGEACNIGLKSVCQEINPALKLDRLNSIKDRYLSVEAIQRGNKCLVEYHSAQALSQKWGGGEVASADGLRFVVPVKNLMSQANPRYFGVKRGVTYYSLMSDQYTQLHGIVVPGTLRDSLYLLASLLEQNTNLEPTEIMTDTAGYSDVIFGLFQLLGYRFSPRLKDIGKARFWRVDRKAKYGEINDLVTDTVNTRLIHEQWDDVMRLVGSLKLGKVKATQVMRVLARGGTLSGLGRALEEIGRISKTLYLCDYLEDESYRRRIHTQLSHGESRHDVARHVFHGHKGRLYKRYQRGLEEQLGVLGLVVNVVIVWNTDYMSAVLNLLRAMGHEVLDEDVARISPLKTRHINVFGEYKFSLHPDVLEGDLRPLRDPNASIGFEIEEFNGEEGVSEEFIDYSSRGRVNFQNRTDAS